jgi:hypothetical protein
MERTVHEHHKQMTRSQQWLPRLALDGKMNLFNSVADGVAKDCGELFR